METYNIHAGHCPDGQGAYGACGILKESTEARAVKDKVIEKLKELDNIVYDCTDDSNCNENQNLVNIVNKCNSHAVDLDISIHLNAGRNDYNGDESTGGVEVWCYNNENDDIAARIAGNISESLNIRNRGVKYSKDLYVLRNTKAKALLIECCFVDDMDDANAWNSSKCAEAIVNGILGCGIENAPAESESTPVEISPTPEPSLPADEESTPSIITKVNIGGSAGWLGEMTNPFDITDIENGCSGASGRTIEAVLAYLTNASCSLKYRVHVAASNGKDARWFGIIDGSDHNINDSNNGYAGLIGREIDAIEMWLEGTDIFDIEYQVQPKGENAYGVIKGVNHNIDDSENGFAGLFGHKIERLCARIIEK